MEFRLLGPLEITRPEPVSLQRRQERYLLGVLLLEQGRIVAADRLIELLWDGRPPAAARSGLRSHVSRIRAAFDASDVRIIRQGSGYLLRTDPDRIDAHRFRSLVGEARQVADPDRRASLLRTALGLWRGPVLADLARPSLGAGLEELRLAALEQRVDAELATGGHDAVIGELRDLVTTHPSRERFVTQLMLALYRSGRQTEALEVYNTGRERLAEAFGLSPGPQARELYLRIVRADPVLDLPARVEVPPAGPRDARRPPTPRQLPHDIAVFTGRAGELAALDALEAAGRSTTGHAPTIVSIDGAPGAGKTTLAVHWAHGVADRYPDAQLYLNLRGHGPGDPVTPAAAMETLLRGLGVDSELIPASVDERAALLRTTLAGRRVLMLLDNARYSDQVRPLLPATAGLVVVTSRNQLRGLSVRNGAHHLTLQPLPAEQAVELLAALVGVDRVAAEQQAAARLVELCDRLPLALAIIGDRAHRAGTLTEVVGALEDEQARLDNLGAESGDPHTDVRAALCWSYRALAPDAAGMFRKLGLNPTGDICSRAAAALADLSLTEACAALDQLVAAHLVEQRRPGRYELHDLVRLYAAEVARATETANDRAEAMRRLLDEYLHAAASADSCLLPQRRRDFMDPYRPSRPPPIFAGRDDALTWFEREYHNLRSVAAWAARHGHAGHAWRIAMTMTTYFDCRIPWRDGLEFYEFALRAAESDGGAGAAYVLNSLGCIRLDKDDLRKAKGYFERALARFEALRHPRGEAIAHGNLGLVYGQLGEPAEARRHSTIALELCERLGYRRGVGLNLDNLGVAFTVAGAYHEAIESFREANRIYRELGDTHSEAETLYHLGRTYASMGAAPRAAHTFRLAAEAYRGIGNRRWEAVALTELGGMLQKIGQTQLARTIWQSALTTMTDLSDPRADTLRAELAELAPT